MGKLFGTDGIRGVVGENLTAELAYRVGQAGEGQRAPSDHWHGHQDIFRHAGGSPYCRDHLSGG